MLPRAKRLTKQRDFIKLAQQGRSIFGPLATLRVRQITGEKSKVAFITSTKVMKKAVDRNRAKRRMREAVRANWNLILPEMHLLFILKPEACTVEYKSMLEEVARLISKIPEALTKPVKPSSRALKHAQKMGRPKTTK
ncbi:MAG: ribonuclease P protein component [Patescibacteria group bacterium]